MPYTRYSKFQSSNLGFAYFSTLAQDARAMDLARGSNLVSSPMYSANAGGRSAFDLMQGDIQRQATEGMINLREGVDRGRAKRQITKAARQGSNTPFNTLKREMAGASDSEVVAELARRNRVKRNPLAVVQEAPKAYTSNAASNVGNAVTDAAQRASSSPVKAAQRFSRRNLAIGAGAALGLGALGAGAYALGRRNNEED